MELCHESKEVMEVENLEGCSFSRISGGERQRVTIARALAQQAGMIVMDEPTNHLDIHHQLKLMRLLRRLNATAVIALHDINLAGCFCDTLVLMSRGRCVACGVPSTVLTPDVLDDVYHVRTNAIRQPNGTVHVTIR